MEQGLKRSLGTTDILALGFGAMIGWGWVILVGNWLNTAGTLGTALAFILGGVMCCLVGLVYAELTSALPLAGGAMVWAKRALGTRVAWVTGWSLVLAYGAVAAWESVATATAVRYLLPFKDWGFIWEVAGSKVYLTSIIPGLLTGLLIWWMNYRGNDVSAKFQSISTFVLIAAGLALIIGCFARGQWARLTPVITGVPGVLKVATMVPFLLVGFDVIPQSAEEFAIPREKASRLLVLSIASAVAWYVFISLAVGLAVPEGARLSVALPAAQAMRNISGNGTFGNLAVYFLVVGGLCGILTSWNAFFIAATRVLFAMGRSDMLPGLGTLHPRHRTPSMAVHLVGLMCVVAPFLGDKALVWLADAGSLGTTVSYLMVVVSFFALRRKEPLLERPFRVPFMWLGWAALVATGGFIFLYMPFSPGSLIWPYEWAIVGTWVTLGVVLYGVASRRGRKMDSDRLDTLHDPAGSI